MRFEWSSERLPELEDVVFQISGPYANDANVVRRAYSVAGIIEGATRDRFKLVMERVDFDEATDAATFGETPWWTFYNLPR